MALLRNWSSAGIVAAIIFCLATSAAADEVCDAVLKSNAFDYYDSTTQQQYEDASFDSLCQTQWTSISDYENKASSLGAGGSYGLISGFLNLNQTDVNSSLSAAYAHLCIQKDHNLREFILSHTRTQFSDVAVNAWTRCIKQSNTVGVFSTIIPEEGSNRFDVHVVYHPQTSTDKLTLMGYSKDSPYSCNIRNFDISNKFSPKDQGIGDDFYIQCSLKKYDTPTSTNFIIETNLENQSIGLFKIPSDQYIDLTKKLSAVQDSIDTLNSQVATMPETVAAHLEFDVEAGPKSFNNPTTATCHSGSLVGGSCMTYCPNQQPGIGPEYSQGENTAQVQSVFSCYRFTTDRCQTQAFAVCMHARQ